MATEQKKSILTMDVGDFFRKKSSPNPRSERKDLIGLSKQTMNLAYHEPVFRLRRVLLVGLMAAMILVLFAKFGIIDPVNRRAEAYELLAASQEQLAQARLQLENYGELTEQYSRYSFGLMTENEINLVNRMDVLELVEREIAPYGSIQNFAVNHNVLTLNIHGITLDRASNMVTGLEQSELVTKASINSASADDGQTARIFLSINLANGEEDG